MSCSKCGLGGHNSRKCPDKDTINVNPPPPKRGRGRPRKNIPVDTPDQTNVHHEMSAQPSQLGRGNRSVRGGQGSRGRGRGAARGASRGVRGVRSEGLSCTTVRCIIYVILM